MKIDFSMVQKNSSYSFCASGGKNVTLPLLFLASGLSIKFQKDIHISNIPKLIDIEICLRYLKFLGVKLLYHEGNITIYGKTSILKKNIPKGLYGEFRYSILSIGLLLSFFDEIDIPDKTGGCAIGERKDNLHYDFFIQAGFDINISGSGISISKKRDPVPHKIVFQPNIASTSVTENIILFCVLSFESITTIEINNFYGIRPDISELLDFASLFGYTFSHTNKVLTSVSYNPITIESPVKYRAMSDFDQALFYILLALVLESDITLENYCNTYDYREISLLNGVLGNIITLTNNTLHITGKGISKTCINLDIIANEYPNIMSDSQPIISILSLFCNTIKISDTRFVGRYNYSQYYTIFGCNASVQDNSLIISHTTECRQDKETSQGDITLFSIRESGTLLLLAIYFRAIISIKNTYILERGYENIFQNLLLIGAKYEKKG